MRATILGSIGVHVALIGLLVVVRPPRPVVVPGPDVVQVALVSPEVATPVAVPPPAPVKPPEKSRETVVPEKGEGVKLAPPPKPKKPEPKPVEPKPAVPAPALPWARVGTAGLSGQLTVDSKDFEFTYYLMLVRNRIAQNWAPPAGLSGAIEAVAYFQIARDGSVRGLRLETPSGLEYFDRSVTRAVVLSDPLPPLPLGFGGPALGVHFGFQWGAP